MIEYHRVGNVSDFEPGMMRPFRLGNDDIAVVKVGEEFHAFSNFCTHEGITLTAGYGHIAREFVVCMMHSSVFKLETGEVVAGPAQDALQIYEVKVEGEDVLVRAN